MPPRKMHAMLYLSLYESYSRPLKWRFHRRPQRQDGRAAHVPISVAQTRLQCRTQLGHRMVADVEWQSRPLLRRLVIAECTRPCGPSIPSDVSYRYARTLISSAVIQKPAPST